MKDKRDAEKRHRLALQRSNAICGLLEAEHAQQMSWRKVASKFELSAGMAYRIARRGYQPKHKATVKKLDRALAEDYDGWKARNLPAIRAILDWADLVRSRR